MSRARNRKELKFMSAKGMNTHFRKEIDYVVEQVRRVSGNTLDDSLNTDEAVFLSIVRHSKAYAEYKAGIISKIVEELGIQTVESRTFRVLHAKNIMSKYWKAFLLGLQLSAIEKRMQSYEGPLFNINRRLSGIIDAAP